MVHRPATRRLTMSSRATKARVFSSVHTGGRRINSGVLVEGNLIGTDPTGTIALGNSGPGVEIGDYSSGNTIGGSAPGTGNLISANAGAGVSISGTTSEGNVVVGNMIGTDPAGTIAMPNSGPGVLITGGATNNTIGGTASGAGNVIAFNASSGVVVGDGATDASTGNVIVNDSIQANTGGGIDNDSSGLLTISGSTIAGNSTTGNGGGIYNNSFATLVITSSTITGNAVGHGGSAGTTGAAASRTPAR